MSSTKIPLKPTVHFGYSSVGNGVVLIFPKERVTGENLKKYQEILGRFEAHHNRNLGSHWCPVEKGWDLFLALHESGFVVSISHAAEIHILGHRDSVRESEGC